jgi:hypothetical protein
MINLEQIDEQGDWVSLTTLDGRQIDLNFWRTEWVYGEKKKENHILITFYPTKPSKDDPNLLVTVADKWFGSFDLTEKMNSMKVPTAPAHIKIDLLQNGTIKDTKEARLKQGFGFLDLLHWDFVLYVNRFGKFVALDFYNTKTQEYLKGKESEDV